MDAAAGAEAVDAAPAAEPPGDAEAAALADKRRIQEQLDALKRREAELRRELAIADHPELRGSLRAIERAAVLVSAADAKIAAGPSKSDARRRDALEKQLAAAHAKRAEVDAKIAEIEAELRDVVGSREAALAEERRAALTGLAATLVEHGPKLAAAGLDLPMLLPGLAGWREDILELTKPEAPPVA
ncbi:MAG TPA: hypothetical protein VHB21_12150 [Minicystis sp.]|nr:hypothetical protein [Minicystis sp.]